MEILEWGIALVIAIPIAGFIASSWNPIFGKQRGPSSFKEGDDIKTGPRGGRYRVTDKGRKSYDVE